MGPTPSLACEVLSEQEIVRLYQEHSAGLFRYAFVLARRREAAQDAVQEAFLRYFTMRSTSGPLRQPKAWLYRVVRNYLLDVRKVAGARIEVGLEELQNKPDARQNPESEYRMAEMSQRLWDSLSGREMECLRLRLEGLRYDEIADVLNLAPGTVGALLARVQKKIRRVAEASHRTETAAPCLLTGTEYPYAP